VFGTDKRRFQLFTFVFGIVTAILPVVLWSIGQLTLRSYCVVVLVWLLISSEVFAPKSSDIQWWNRLKWVKLAGWIVLGYIVFERITAVV
jgi:prolipoprotein diacylglyceryltransferase